MANPVLVEIRRGDTIESWHRGALAVLNSAGETLVELGDTNRPIYPRSAIKPLQAIPLVESGAAHRFELDDKQISLACASHGGEPMHVQAVQDWLYSLSLGSDDLACGAHLPSYTPAAAALLEQGQPATALHNNCSGKHGGFLTLARHFGVATEGYIEPDHAAQLAWRDVLREMSDDDLSARPQGIDGCGIPVVGIPLGKMALAMARFADPRGLGPVRSEAIARIQQALAAEPLMMAGTGRLCTETIRLTQGRALIKTGAEGVYTGAVPASGLGIALKIDDGNGRAANCVIATVLKRFDVLHDDEWRQLRSLACPPVENVAGVTVGSTEAAHALSFSL
jgi:L-asparaginase II